MNNSYYPRYSSSRRPPYHQIQNINPKQIKEPHPEFKQSVSKKEHHPEFKQPILKFSNLDINTPILEFHGIQIYQDDLLILMLLFFLYKENVNDGLLYIALLALLVLEQ